MPEAPDLLSLPPIDPRWLAALDAAFPLRNPAWDTPIDRVRYEAGRRAVVEWLLSISAQQRQRALGA